jgi:hypothetical protein
MRQIFVSWFEAAIGFIPQPQHVIFQLPHFFKAQPCYMIFGQALTCLKNGAVTNPASTVFKIFLLPCSANAPF